LDLESILHGLLVKQEGQSQYLLRSESCWSKTWTNRMKSHSSLSQMGWLDENRILIVPWFSLRTNYPFRLNLKVHCFSQFISWIIGNHRTSLMLSLNGTWLKIQWILPLSRFWCWIR
jgi:hypothetical protein